MSVNNSVLLFDRNIATGSNKRTSEWSVLALCLKEMNVSTCVQFRLFLTTSSTLQKPVYTEVTNAPNIPLSPVNSIELEKYL